MPGARAMPQPAASETSSRPDRHPSGPAYAAELLGTLMLVFCVTTLAAVAAGGAAVDLAAVGVLHVLVLALLIHSLGGTSGAHLNPAVTLALLALRKIAPRDAAAYVAVQVLGAVGGALLCRALLPDEGAAVRFGATVIQDDGFLDGSAGRAVVCEAIATFFLMWAIMAMAVDPRGDRNAAPWVIGGTVGAMVILFAPLTGGSLNPARTLGPAVVSGHFEDLWVYLAGPVAGALTAAVAYTALVLAPHRRAGERPVDHLE